MTDQKQDELRQAADAVSDVPPPTTPRYQYAADIAKESGLFEHLHTLTAQSVYRRWLDADTVEERERMHATMHALTTVMDHFNLLISRQVS